MKIRRETTKGEKMIQWVGVIIALLGLAYNGVKDYQKGDIKIPALPQKQVLTKPVYPIQYCLMAYDPNIDKVFYLHENGQWHDYAPQQRRYSPQAEPQQNQAQGQATVGVGDGTSRASRYAYGQSPQATANPIR
jgi:hypothetical protein